MALGGEKPKFDNLKIGYDNNSDNDIDDAGDYVVINDAFDGTSVSNRDAINGTTYFFYDGPEVIGERDGSESVVQQFVYGPNHIDELAMIRGQHGAHFVYQDANWNVIGLTSPAGYCQALLNSK